MQLSEAPRRYTDLAEWWPLFSPPMHYVEEAAAGFRVSLRLDPCNRDVFVGKHNARV
jgi:hypothetical protein